MAEDESLPPVDPFPAWDTHGVDGTCDLEHPELVMHIVHMASRLAWSSMTPLGRPVVPLV